MTLVVVAAAVTIRDGRVLVTRRPQGVHLEGQWEFPGGKIEPGETVAEALRRELREELDIESHVGPEILVITHDYPERTIEIHFLECHISQEPSPRLAQEIRWVTRGELRRLPFPPADLELIRRLTSGDEPGLTSSPLLP